MKISSFLHNSWVGLGVKGYSCMTRALWCWSLRLDCRCCALSGCGWMHLWCSNKSDGIYARLGVIYKGFYSFEFGLAYFKGRIVMGLSYIRSSGRHANLDIGVYSIVSAVSINLWPTLYLSSFHRQKDALLVMRRLWLGRITAFYLKSLVIAIAWYDIGLIPCTSYIVQRIVAFLWYVSVQC